MLKYLFSLLFVFFGPLLFAQCGVEIENVNDTVSACPNYPIELNANASIPLIFGSCDLFVGPPPPFWDSISEVVFSNPCGPNTYTTASNGHFWFVGDSGRLASTNPINLDYPFAEVCFDFKMASQGSPFPCEGPDLIQEGVSLSYSIDDGLTWVDIVYLAPGGYILPSMPPGGNSWPSPTPYIFLDWDQYCFEIPSQALTANTKLKWEQFFPNNSIFDNWGMDNVVLKAQPQGYGFFWDGVFSNADSINYLPTQDTTVYVLFTDGVSDTCIDSIFVDVNYNPTNTIVYDTICAGQSFTINNGLVVNATGVYQDTFAGLNCDSIFTNNLYVTPISNQAIMDTVSFCDSIVHNGTAINNTITLVDTLVDGGGCLYLFSTTFIKNGNTTSTTLNALSFCDSINYDSTTYYTNQQIVDTLVSLGGCDSIVIQDLVLDNLLLGKVTTSAGANLSNSKVYLVEYAPTLDSLYLKDSTITSLAGNYSFQNAGANNYIKAIPDSLLYPNEIPTYFLNSMVFQFAQTTYCDTFDFSTMSGVNPGGSGFVSGLLGNGAGKNNELGEAIKGFDVILMSNNQVVAVSKTNPDGYFEFDNLACTTFKIWIDDLRVDNNLAPEIDLSSGFCDMDSLIFTLDETGLKMEVPTGLASLNLAYTYKLIPNPANQQVRLVFDSEVIIQQVVVMDIFGRVVETKNIRAKELNIETKAWSNGLYKVVLYGKDNTYLGSKSLMIQH